MMDLPEFLTVAAIAALGRTFERSGIQFLYSGEVAAGPGVALR